VHNITHEDLSAVFMDRLNSEFGGQLDIAIKIFRINTRKDFTSIGFLSTRFDRLDYLGRDSFFTGVSEGIVSSDRIVKCSMW